MTVNRENLAKGGNLADAEPRPTLVEARKMLKDAEDQGQCVAGVILDMIDLAEGSLVVDSDEHRQRLEHQVAKGSVSAYILQAGKSFDTNKDLADNSTALRMFETLADLGSVFWQMHLANYYFLPLHYSKAMDAENIAMKDPDKALKYAKMAAKSHDPYAAFLLASLLLHHSDRHYKVATKQDFKESLLLLHVAADNKSAKSARLLGVIYCYGDNRFGVKADMLRGMKYLRFADAQGDVHARKHMEYIQNIERDRVQRQSEIDAEEAQRQLRIQMYKWDEEFRYQLWRKGRR